MPGHGSRELTLAVRAFASGGPAPADPAPPAVLRDRQSRDTEAFTRPSPDPGEPAAAGRGLGRAGEPAGAGRELNEADEPSCAGRELARAAAHGLADLARLRVPVTGVDGEPLRVPGAGIPWFLTLFGRDALLTSLFTLPYRPGTAAATLSALAAAQGTGYVPERLEQPGRIPHELRHGELAHFRQVPYGRYYGSVDATPLFLVTLQAHAEATGDPALARRLEGTARAAVEWMFRDAMFWLKWSINTITPGMLIVMLIEPMIMNSTNLGIWLRL